MSDRKDEPKVCRLNRVGGQAVLEGVMMKAGERTVTSCRNEQGEIVVQDGSFVSVRKKHRILDLPIIRGFVNFIEMMVLSFKTLGFSAEVMGIDDEEEKKKKEAEGKKSNTVDVIMFFSIILGILLAAGLFFILPAYAAKGICWLFNLFVPSVAVPSFAVAIIEGIMKMIILLTYLALVTLMPDIRRTFQYHGAEHKSIACFEAGDELTPENAMKHRRFHPRCGTSFMFLMILIGMFVGMFVRFILPPEEAFAFIWLHPLLVSAIKILLLPLTMGIGYEILMLAGKHDNIVTRIISAPGMWVQRITTKEPTLEMLEIAITSIKCALRDDFPEFMEFYNSRGWEKKAENTEETVEIADDATEVAEPAEAAIDEQTAEAEEVAEAEEIDGQTEPLTSEDNENGGIADTASERAE